jgi:hypothetical protein
MIKILINQATLEPVFEDGDLVDMYPGFFRASEVEWTFRQVVEFLRLNCDQVDYSADPRQTWAFGEVTDARGNVDRTTIGFRDDNDARKIKHWARALCAVLPHKML